MTDSAQTASKRCPACDSPLDDQQYAEVEARHRDNVKRSVEAERQKLDEQYRRDTEAFQKAADQKAAQRAEASIAEAAKERDAAVERAKTIQEEADSRRKEAVSAEVARVREALEKDRDEAVLNQKVEFGRKQDALQKRLDALQRQMEERTANELGDGAEIDLYDALRDLFPEDDITRVKKGEPGADIWIKVRHKGEVCGLILIDSKNRKSWQTTFATKLREDQVEAEADYAILSTTTFPKEKKQLTIESDVIVASPARVPEIVQILRSAIIKLHILGLSKERRAEKREALYEYITSENFSLKVEEIGRLTEKLLDLDVQETRQHQTVWKKRGTMLKKQQRSLHDIDVEVSAIIQGDDD